MSVYIYIVLHLYEFVHVCLYMLSLHCMSGPYSATFGNKLCSLLRNK